jgi:hypothetical protein
LFSSEGCAARLAVKANVAPFPERPPSKIPAN